MWNTPDLEVQAVLGEHEERLSGSERWSRFSGDMWNILYVFNRFSKYLMLKTRWDDREVG